MTIKETEMTCKECGGDIFQELNQYARVIKVKQTFDDGKTITYFNFETSEDGEPTGEMFCCECEKEYTKEELEK